MKRRLNAWLLCTGTLSILCAPVGAHAQEVPGATIDEVVVTATRREQSLQQVPIAVSTLSAEDLIARGLTSPSEIPAGSIPGVNFQTVGGSPSLVTAAVRGAAIADPNQGTVEMPVPFYVDGVFLGRSQGVGLELIEPERIEVLRGPQGQLFGRNAEGGVVQIVARKPSGNFGVRASASFGNYDDRRYRLALDLPQVAGISTSIAGFSSDHDAYTKTTDRPQTYVPPAPQKPYGYLDAKGFRAALRWSADDNPFTADYVYDYTDQQDSQGYLTWTAVNTGAPPTSPVPATDDFRDHTFDQQYNLPFDTEASGHALTLAWKQSDAMTFKSITSYRKVTRDGGSNFAGALVAGVSSNGFFSPVTMEEVDQDQTSQELQFIGTWERFDVTAGAIYFNEEVKDRRPLALTGPGLVGPVTFIAPAGLGFCVQLQLDPCLIDDKRQRAETDSYGAYVQGGYRPAAFDDRLELIVGLRYSDDSKDARRTFNLATGGPVNEAANFDETRFDPAVTARYQWTSDINTYVRYATGYRAGGASVRSNAFTSFGSEEAVTWELGLKSRWAEGRVRLNAALFHNTIKDEQITIQQDPIGNPNLTNTINSPKDKKIAGAEAEVVWAPTSNLRFGLNFTYLDVDETIDVDNPFTPNLVDFTRYWIIQVPETSGSVSADYEHPLAIGNLALNISYAYSSDYQNSPGAIPVAAVQPGYERPGNETSQLAGRLAWRALEVGGGKMEVALWGKNLTNDESIIYGFDGCAFGGGFCTYRALPRTYGVELRYEY